MRLPPEEQEIIAAAREQIRQGRTWADLEKMLKLSPEAARIAERWEALNDDSRHVIYNAIIQEERYVSHELKHQTGGGCNRKPAK